MDDIVPVLAPPAGSPQPPRRRPSAGAVLTLVNGVMAGIGGIYATTHSITITVIASVVAIALAAMVLIAQRLTGPQPPGELASRRTR